MTLVILLYTEGNEEATLILVLLNTCCREWPKKNECLMKTSGSIGKEYLFTKFRMKNLQRMWCIFVCAVYDVTDY